MIAKKTTIPTIPKMMITTMVTMMSDANNELPLAGLREVADKIMENQARTVSGFSQDQLAVLGLCPSCHNSGLQRGMRDGVWGAVVDDNGNILRCECKHGKRSTKKNGER